MRFRQPKNCEPKGSAQVTTGYFRDLAATIILRLTTTSSSVGFYRRHLFSSFCSSCCCGGHVRMGPPSRVGTCGTAAATYVPTNPSIRTEILTICFICILLTASLASQNGTNLRGEEL